MNSLGQMTRPRSTTARQSPLLRCRRLCAWSLVKTLALVEKEQRLRLRSPRQTEATRRAAAGIVGAGTGTAVLGIGGATPGVGVEAAVAAETTGAIVAINEMIRVIGDGGGIRVIRVIRVTEETGGAQVEVETAVAGAIVRDKSIQLLH